jgi:methyl coenzyme M reductase beta subunit
MAAFEASNFEDHPSIASEYVKFLATNSGLEVVSKMEEEVVHMKKQVKELEKSVALSVVRADKALSAVDVLKKENAAMARKIG